MPEEKSAVEIVRDCYSSLPELRAAIQLLPFVGGSIDTLMLGRMGQIQMARLEHLVGVLQARLGGLERTRANIESEAFADLVFATFEKASRTRSEPKRVRFAAILSRQVQEANPWEEPDAAVRMLADLNDIHISVLNVALNAPVMGGPFPSLRVISPAANKKALRSEAIDHDPVFLPGALPEYNELALRMAVTDLLSRGLLHDEGIGRWGTVNMEYLVPTDLAVWFARWISEE